MSKYRIIFLLLVVGASSPAVAVDTLQVTTTDPVLESWRWTAFDRTSGLSGAVNEVFEDRDGNIWFATDRGVQRYDGIYWTTYTEADGLAYNNVRDIAQTRDGAMWFATANKRISRFDGRTWTIHDLVESRSLSTPKLLETRDGALWVGLYAEIHRFDGQTWTQIETPEALTRTPRSMYEASDGALWITTFLRGVFRLDRSAGGGWTRYTTEAGLADNTVWDMLESRDGVFWFACGRGEISRFDGVQWKTHTAGEGLLEGASFQSLWQTADGTLWAGGRGALCRFDGKRWHTYSPRDLPRMEGDIFGRPGRDGAVWIYIRGRDRVFRFAPASTKWTVYDGVLPDGRIGAGRYGGAPDVIFSYKNEIWFGGNNGAVRYDGNTWVRYTASDGLIDGPVLTVLKARDGSIWAGGQHRGKSGAARYDGTRWRVFTEADGLAGNNIYTGFAAANGDIWFGTKFEGGEQYGAMRFDGKTWTVYTTADGLAHNMVYDITQTLDGAMWFATRGGCSRFDGVEWTNHKLEAEDPGIAALCAARDGGLWMGFDGASRGAMRYDGRTWKRYTTEDGLAGDVVVRIYQGRDNAIWIGTNAGLSRFDGSNWTTYSWDDIPTSGGIQINSICESSDGALWLRGTRGPVIRFLPDADRPETISGQNVKQVSSAGNILLKWSGHDLWNDTPRQVLRYQWRLDGGAWSPASGRTDLTFTALSSGGHTFEVRAMDQDMNIDPTPAVHAFVVESPWWRNPWVVGLAAVLLGLVGVQTGRIIRRDRLLRVSNVALSDANRDLFQANRELQRDRAAERIRGEVQAMEQASDFERVLSVLVEDLKAVGLSFDTCEIDVLEEPVEAPTMAHFEQHGFRYTTYTIDPDGAVVQESYHTPAPFPPVVRETIEKFISGEPWMGTSGETAIVEVPAAGYGRLRFTALGQDGFGEDETATLQEFASAIALEAVLKFAPSAKERARRSWARRANEAHLVVDAAISSNAAHGLRSRSTPGWDFKTAS